MSHIYRSHSKQRTPGHNSRSNTPSKRNKSQKDDIFTQIMLQNQEDAEDQCDLDEDEELDPRVQDELERLNSCTDEINQLENELEEANCLFRTLLTDSTHQLKALSKKIGGNTIEKGRPYFEALEISNKAQKECQAAATAYQRAHGIHAAAKETIALAEQRFLSNSTEWEFDNAWQEMLNHATIKVMAAEKQKTESEAEHLKLQNVFTAAEQEVQNWKRSWLSKSRKVSHILSRRMPSTRHWNLRRNEFKNSKGKSPKPRLSTQSLFEIWRTFQSPFMSGENCDSFGLTHHQEKLVSQVLELNWSTIWTSVTVQVHGPRPVVSQLPRPDPSGTRASTRSRRGIATRTLAAPEVPQIWLGNSVV